MPNEENTFKNPENPIKLENAPEMYEPVVVRTWSQAETAEEMEEDLRAFRSLVYMFIGHWSPMKNEEKSFQAFQSNHFSKSIG